MATEVIPSKTIAEVHEFVADFTPLLLAGETLSFGSWVTTITVLSGTDPNPSGLIFAPATVLGNVISQQLTAGLPGVIYWAVITVTTSLGHHLTLDTKLAVLPNNYPANGVYITLYETSQPYPIYSTPYDTLSLRNVSVLAGVLTTTLVNVGTQDTFHISNVYVANSIMYTTVLNTSQQDTIHFSNVNVGTSTLTTVVVNVSIQDTIHFNAAVLNSTLTTVVINNSQQDTMHFTNVFVTSSTLT